MNPKRHIWDLWRFLVNTKKLTKNQKSLETNLLCYNDNCNYEDATITKDNSLKQNSVTQIA